MGRILVVTLRRLLNHPMNPALPLVIGVDDETDDIFFLRRMIEKTGVPHRFQPYSNCEAAMVALSAVAAGEPSIEPPIVCFLDIKMVGLSGFDLLRWIRAQRGLDAIPVIMFSSSDYPADVEMARDLGAQGYLKKYPSVAAMRTVLDQAIDFSRVLPPKKTFLQWSYRFIDSPNAMLAVK
jgi:CheY-like chemotaxis protein